MFGAIGNTLGAVGSGIGNAAGAVGDAIGGTVGAVGDAAGAIGDAAGNVAGTAVRLPGDVASFFGNNGGLLGDLARYQFTHAGSPDVAKVIGWAKDGQKGAPPTDDPVLLNTLIASKDPAAASLLGAFLKAHPEQKADVVAVQKWAIASKGRGVPPTNDPTLLASLIGLKQPKLGTDLAAYVQKHPNKAGDAAKLEKWLIASGGKPHSLPPTFDPGLLLVLARFGLRKVVG